MPSTTRRRLLASLAGTAAAATAGCVSLPAGPTPGVTDYRRRRLAVPRPDDPVEPTDARVLALRAFLDARVTAAEPLFADVTRDELGADAYLRCGTGVAGVRRDLAASAAAPASMDYGHALSEVGDACWALGYLRAWHDREDVPGALERGRAALESVRAAARSMPTDCTEPGRYLARVGGAERRLALGARTVREYDDRTAGAPSDLGRAERAERVARIHRDAGRAAWRARAARYVARAYREARPPDAAGFADALAGNRERVLSRVAELAPPDGRPERLAEAAEGTAASHYLRRAGNPVGSADRARWRARRNADRGLGAYAAVQAGRARCHLAGYRRVVDADAAALADGVDADALFATKRRVVRLVRESLADADPLPAWLLDEPARLVAAGEGYLGPESVVDDPAGRRAVCLSFYRHAEGYARAAPSVAATLERR